MNNNVQVAFLFEIPAAVLKEPKLFDQFRITIKHLDEQLRGKETFVRQMGMDA